MRETIVHFILKKNTFGFLTTSAMLWKDNPHFLRDGVDELKLKRINIIDLKSWLEREANVKEMAFGNS